MITIREYCIHPGDKPKLPNVCEARGHYEINGTVWLKWLDYEPEFEKELIQTLSSKDPSTLSLGELQILTKYQERKRISQLIKKYETDFVWDEWEEANNYLQTKSIKKLIFDKLSQEEKEYAKLEIERLRQIPYKEWKKKIEEMIEGFAGLSMVDSYILHEITEIDCNRSVIMLNEKIRNAIESDKMLSRVPEFHPLKQ